MNSMSVEFVDTNILVYAHDGAAGEKHRRAVDLLGRLFAARTGALSVQVLCEFCLVATRKMGISSQEVREILADLAGWTTYRTGYHDVLRALELQQRYKIGWWDALVVNAAVELGCEILWSEDLGHGQRYAGVDVRNPFATER